MESSSHEQRRQIGNYTLYLDEKLGSGKFAHVYLARDNRNSKYVAIKEFTDEKAFQCEAKILKQLHDQPHHSHILSYIDQVGYKPEPHYIVVELARGGTLREYIASLEAKPMETKQAVKTLKQIGDAVSFIHKQNILHCDITPENILFDDYSHTNAVLADFGIAVELESGDDFTLIAPSRGDDLYMAPERFDGTATKRSDQYSLGCIAYELFTGLYPFGDINTLRNAGSEEMKKRHKEAKYRPLGLNETLPKFIEEAILKAIEIKPEERHKDIDAFLRAIEPIEEEKSVDLSEASQSASSSEQDTAETLNNLRLSGSFQEFIDALKGISYPMKEGTLIAGSTGGERQCHYISYDNNFRILIYIPKKFLSDLGLIEMVFEDFSHSNSEFSEENPNNSPRVLSRDEKFILVFLTVSYISRAFTRVIEKKGQNENGMRVEVVLWGHLEETLKELKKIDESNSRLKEPRKRKVIEDILRISRSEK